MTKKSHHPEKTQESQDKLHANSAYSGSGAMQPGGNTGEAGKQDNFEGTLDEATKASEAANGTVSEDPKSSE